MIEELRKQLANKEIESSKREHAYEEIYTSFIKSEEENRNLNKRITGLLQEKYKLFCIVHLIKSC